MKYLGKPVDYGQRKHDEYTQNDYHKVSDQVKPGWDLRGAVEDLGVLFDVGLNVANGASYPEWKAGSEFKARREEMLRKSRH